jgi:hypothetical protein
VKRGEEEEERGRGRGNTVGEGDIIIVYYFTAECTTNTVSVPGRYEKEHLYHMYTTTGYNNSCTKLVSGQACSKR